MKRLKLSVLATGIMLGSLLIALVAQADDKNKLSVSAAFGRGLNTGGLANHAILPGKIKVTEDGVVHFLVSGFHQVVVYNAGKEVGDVVVPAVGAFINDAAERFYLGIAPQGGPLATPGNTNPLNGSNRMESISFAEPGRYLVICNVRTHFLDGMFATVEVEREDD